MFIPEVKLQRAVAKVEGLLEARGMVPVRELASVAGLLVSFNLAMGDITRFYTRSMMMLIAEITEKWGWRAKMEVTQRVTEELKFWKQNLGSLNGFRMRKEDKVMVLRRAEMFSDASEYLLGGAQFKGKELVPGSSYQAALSELEWAESSTYRELRAIEEGIRVRGESLRGHLCRWGCDNWAAAQIVRLGSMKVKCHEVAKRIRGLARELEIELEPYWLSRDELQIQFCDGVSKDFDTADYKLSSEDFSGLAGQFGPFTTDFFASSSSYQFQPFYAKLPCSMAAGCDAFTANWGALEFGFFHPPVGVIVRVVRYAEQCKAGGLLVVPDWPGSVFMVVIRSLEAAGKVRQVRRFRPWLESPPWLKSRTFQGTPKFDFLAFLYNF